MDSFRPPPAPRLFRRHARIVEPHLIEKVTVSIGVGCPCCCGDRIDDGSKVTLACPACLLRHLSILDVRACAVPPHDLSGVVAQGLRANEKPPINAIMTAKT